MYDYNPYNSNSKNILNKFGKLIFFENSLFIETYFIGYKTEGEAILIFIRCDEKISFSGLVDCYKLDDVDKVTEILKQNKIPKLDFICWSHPDFDHSKGLKDIINSYAAEETCIWIPEGVDIGEIKCSEEVNRLFTYLKECVRDTKSKLNVYSASDKKDMLCYNSICFQKGADEFPLKLDSYSPNSKIIRKQTYLDKFIKNDRSIFFVLSLGDVRILLTGDIEDGTIEKLPKKFFHEHIHLLKIPHHGSSTSCKIMELGWTGCDVACSTVYRKGISDLPKKEIMSQYNENTTKLFCTGHINASNEKESYGILKVSTDVLQNKYETKLEGNAALWNT